MPRRFLGSRGRRGLAAARAILALAPGLIRLFRELYPGMLFNIVDERNAAAVRFLRWAGFTIQGPIQLGPAGEGFCPFYIEGKP